jgi:diaminopimelate epimerase
VTGAGERVSRRLREREFAKYHGLGNDYVVIDAERFGARLTPARVRAICKRHSGVGADGVLALSRSRLGDFAVRIFNPDGSEAEKSGNGLRILARFLYEFGYTRRTQLSIETRGGLVSAELSLRQGRVDQIRVEMGRASFHSDEIPVRGPGREVVNEELRVGSESLRVTCVSVGNPHCVVFVPELRIAELRRLGPLLENHPSFPNRSNVQLARVLSPKLVETLIWERGAGETLASGSSACAVAAAAFRNGRLERRARVAMAGGKLLIEIGEAFAIRMTGPCSPVYRGRLLDFR